MPTVTQVLEERADVVTTRIYTNPTESASTGQTSTPTKVPVGAIVGGIIAGVAVACIIGGLWWWCAGRREKQRDARHKAAASKRARQRAASNASRPSISSQRNPSSKGVANSGHHEKAPPVPNVPVAYYESGNGRKEQAYGYASQDRDQHSPVDSTHSSTLLAAPLPNSATSSTQERPSRSHKSSSRSRPTPSASSSSSASSPTSPIKKYAPAKPSPLAAAGITAAERQRGDVGGMKWGEGPFRTPEEAQRDREEADAQAQWAAQAQTPSDPYQYRYEEEHERDYHAAAGDVGVAVSGYPDQLVDSYGGRAGGNRF